MDKAEQSKWIGYSLQDSKNTWERCVRTMRGKRYTWSVATGRDRENSIAPS